MSEVTANLMAVLSNTQDDIATQLEALVGAPAVTLEVDFRFEAPANDQQVPVVWNPSGFSLSVSDNAIRASVKTTDGTTVHFRQTDKTFSDLEWHRAEVTIDATNNIFRVAIDGHTVFERVDLDITPPGRITETRFGGAPGSASTGFELGDPTAIVAKVPDTIIGVLQQDGLVEVDFDAPEPAAGLLLRGDAFIDANGTLNLDGNGDYAVLAEENSLDGANYLAVDLDFRYDDAADIGNARLIWNQGAFGVRVNENSISVMVTDEKGDKDYIWKGGLKFGDLDWHHISLTVDMVNGVLTTSVDGALVINQTGLSLSLPSTPRPITIGSDSWGSSLNGQIDNLTLTTERPREQSTDPEDGENWDAVGLANPSIATNTTGYIKWAESTAATFIDRMKGSFAWSGEHEILHQDSGNYHIFNTTAVFNDPTQIEDIAFTSETLLNLNRLISNSRWGGGLINKAQFDQIMANYNDYFKISIGPSGNSQLVGRLDLTDKFTVLAQFDTDIGMTLGQLRANGQAWVRPADLKISFDELSMDKNGWLTELPTNAAGGVGEASTIVMWYPEETAHAPDSIYSGTFYLLAEGQGTVSLQQTGKSAGRVNINNIEIDGPTKIPFQYTPDGERVTLTIKTSDPDNTGEYVRNIHIVHENHLEMFEAGEIFTPEFVELHQDDRAVRWMTAQDANRLVPNASGNFEDVHTKDYYSFNLGTNGTDRNGVPIDAIIAFANKTGSDPWINVPINASDDYMRGMAEFVEANLDPRLTLHVEFANENWNSVFPTYHTSIQEGLERWGELRLEQDAQGQFVRDINGDLIVLEDGFFFNPKTASQNGFKNLHSLADEAGLSHALYSSNQAWAEWSSMRATEMAVIFDEVFTAADPDGADARLNKVMATYTNWAKSTDFLMQANVWRDAEPGNWIDPASVFDSLAVTGYFGGTAGNKHSDMVRYWIDNYGEDKAAELLVRQLKSGSDPTLNVIEFESHSLTTGNTIKPLWVQTGVAYTPELVIDVYDAIYGKNVGVRQDIQSAAGLKGPELLVGDDVHNFVRLETAASGNTVLQLRVNPSKGDFETIVEFDSPLSLTIEQMLEEGTLFVRSLPSIVEGARTSFNNQKAKADAYGLDFIAYEGGQHLAAATWGAYSANLSDATLTDFLADLNASPEIGELYAYWLEAWQEAGGNLFAHYSDYGMPSRYGTWGTLKYLGEQNDPNAETHRFDVLQEVNQQGAWWDDNRAPDAFLHGITNTGTPGDDYLRGTAEEDVLLGGAGDDEILGGPGNDALGGGIGVNIVDAGSGDDVILLASTADQIDGGEGWDIVRLSSDLADLDAADLNATNIEAIDLRNYAETTFRLSANDAFTLTSGNILTIFAESADTLELTGLIHQGTAEIDGMIINAYTPEDISIITAVEISHTPEHYIDMIFHN